MVAFKKTLYTGCYFAVIIFYTAFILTAWRQMHQQAGCILAAGFVSLAIAFSGSNAFKGYWYSVAILAVATVTMYFPQYFKTIGGKEASFFIPFFLQAIMFGMGTELSLQDFARVVRMPRGVIVGIVCRYTIMPLVGFTLAHLFNFPDEIAAGIILIGCCPSGLASNVMCYLAKANLALSVSVTTVSTLLAPFLTPLLMKLLGGSFVTIDIWSTVWDHKDCTHSYCGRARVSLCCSGKTKMGTQEVGTQNAGLASALAKGLGKIATVDWLV